MTNNTINKLKAEIIRLKSLLQGAYIDLKEAEKVRKKLVKKIKERKWTSMKIVVSLLVTILTHLL